MRIALVAGEASGDLLGAGLVEQLRRRWPNAHFVGIGGDAMRAAGTETWFDASELAVMGLSEVLRHLPRLLLLRRELRQRLLDYRDDCLGGAYYLFLRGMPAAGVYFARPDDALLDALDRLFAEGR